MLRAQATSPAAAGALIKIMLFAARFGGRLGVVGCHALDALGRPRVVVQISQLVSAQQVGECRPELFISLAAPGGSVGWHR